jgi:protein gp37
MAKDTRISWCDHTFNIVWGCTKVSAGCAHCYAERLAKRLDNRKLWGPDAERRVFGEHHWHEPEAWNGNAEREGVRRRVFACSMCDVFDEHPSIGPEREKLWALINRTPNLDWLIVTKRPARITECLPADWGEGYANVWLGVTIESGEYAHRADTLRSIPAVVRFISYEPALGPLDSLSLEGIDWVIYGGESGPHHRPDDLDWARIMKQRCDAKGITMYFKQRGGLRPGMEPTLDGEALHAYPTPRTSGPGARLEPAARLVAEVQAWGRSRSRRTRRGTDQGQGGVRREGSGGSGGFNAALVADLGALHPVQPPTRAHLPPSPWPSSNTCLPQASRPQSPGSSVGYRPAHCG